MMSVRHIEFMLFVEHKDVGLIHVQFTEPGTDALPFSQVIRFTQLFCHQLERIQSRDERAVFDESIRCILCACCTASCPVTPESSSFLGPAALLRAFRYLFDSRDRAGQERMKLLDSEDGIWGCKTHWKCTEVCPKEIPVTKSLGRTKKRIHDAKKAGELN